MDKIRATFFSSTLDIFTGIFDNNRINIGLLEYRTNVINGKSVPTILGFVKHY